MFKKAQYLLFYSCSNTNISENITELNGRDERSSMVGMSLAQW